MYLINYSISVIVADLILNEIYQIYKFKEYEST